MKEYVRLDADEAPFGTMVRARTEMTKPGLCIW